LWDADETTMLDIYDILIMQQAEIEALNRTKVSCIHCGKVMDVSNHGKYHGIKCKSVVSVQQ
jgi:hypothetical protein